MVLKKRQRFRTDGKVCVICSKLLKSYQQKYCSYECKVLQKQKKWAERNPIRGKTSATTGAISELRVAVDLLIKGYDVFRALSPNCPCDLAILKDGKLLRVEVRTVYEYAVGKFYRNSLQRDDLHNIDVYAWVLSSKIIYEPALI